MHYPWVHPPSWRCHPLLNVGCRRRTWGSALNHDLVGDTISHRSGGSHRLTFGSLPGLPIAARQALPHPEIGWMSSSTGSRSLDFTIKRTSDNADWVVASASIKGNWRRRRYLARGSLVHEDEFEGAIYKNCHPTGPWQQRVIFDPPVGEGALVIHHEALDCEVKLKLTLRTLPSPTVVRRIKLRGYRPRS